VPAEATDALHARGRRRFAYLLLGLLGVVLATAALLAAATWLRL
jgi:hypothetical protein